MGLGYYSEDSQAQVFLQEVPPALYRTRAGRPWPSMIGMDEHAYGKNKEARRTQFVTTIVNLRHASRSASQEAVADER
jgi:hypothetical protein